MNNVLLMLEKSAKNYPNKVAIEDQNTAITYSNYFEQARIIGSSIANRINTTNQPIIVLTNDSVECLVAFMGILYSGNFYVPIDCNQPINRLINAIKTVDPVMIISMNKNDDAVDVPHLIKYSQLLNYTKDSDRLEVIKQGRSILDPVFGMFTSGSTGTPKLVIKNHFSILDMINQFTDVFHFDERSTLGNQAPLYFDVSAKDIYLSICHGASLHILPKSYFIFPTKLIDYINNKKINTLIWSGFAMRLLEKFKVFNTKTLKSVNLIMFSGEVLSQKVLAYWQSNVNAEFVNLYGTTETTFNCTYYRINSDLKDGKILPIGRAFPNNKVILLDNNDNEVTSINEKGEICVMGTSLAMGYYNDLLSTSRSFVQNPINGGFSEIMYRTGDLGYYTEDGDLVFLSRKDHQIKHMGYRIELDEVEHAVNNIDKIDICCCIYNKEKEKIILYYQSKEPISAEIFRELKRDFPKQMIPNQLYHTRTLPLNKNGKVDRIALKENGLES